jgi:hypothetical protein
VKVPIFRPPQAGSKATAGEEQPMKPGRLTRSLTMAIVAASLLSVSTQLTAADDSAQGSRTVVVIVTYKFPAPVSLADVRRAAARGAQRYLNLPGLLRKNYWLSEDGMRAGGIYVWESRARAEAFYTPEWRQFFTEQYGVPPELEYLHSPVTVDNAAGRIVVDAE